MDILSHNVATNLRNIRRVRNMSLEAVAEQTGISKSMLGQIEREQSNPTIAVLGKIVSGLRVDFDDLIHTPSRDISVIRRGDINPGKEIIGKFKVFNYFPYEKKRPFEICRMEIESGAEYEAHSRGEKSREYVMVEEGQLTLTVDDKRLKAIKGEAIDFVADKPHIYGNSGKDKLILTCVFSFPDK